jgi:hypothetical protein
MGNGTGGPSGRGRAEKGQRVGVALEHIKGDKREQAERFLDLFWRNADAWPVEDQQTRDNTRLLCPTAANEDGTYTYAWIFDPFVEGADYSIRNLLKKMYGDEKAAEYVQLWVDAHASDQVEYVLLQT